MTQVCCWCSFSADILSEFTICAPIDSSEGGFGCGARGCRTRPPPECGLTLGWLLGQKSSFSSIEAPFTEEAIHDKLLARLSNFTSSIPAADMRNVERVASSGSLAHGQWAHQTVRRARERMLSEGRLKQEGLTPDAWSAGARSLLRTAQFSLVISHL